MVKHVDNVLTLCLTADDGLPFVRPCSMQTAARAMLARVSRAAVARSGAAPFCAVAEGGSKSVGKPEEAKLERIEDLNRKGKGKGLFAVHTRCSTSITNLTVHHSSPSPNHQR